MAGIPSKQAPTSCARSRPRRRKADVSVGETRPARPDLEGEPLDARRARRRQPHPPHGARCVAGPEASARLGGDDRGDPLLEDAPRVPGRAAPRRRPSADAAARGAPMSRGPPLARSPRRRPRDTHAAARAASRRIGSSRMRSGFSRWARRSPWRGSPPRRSFRRSSTIRTCASSRRCSRIRGSRPRTCSAGSRSGIPRPEGARVRGARPALDEPARGPDRAPDTSRSRPVPRRFHS